MIAREGGGGQNEIIYSYISRKIVHQSMGGVKVSLEEWEKSQVEVNEEIVDWLEFLNVFKLNNLSDSLFSIIFGFFRVKTITKIIG